MTSTAEQNDLMILTAEHGDVLTLVTLTAEHDDVLTLTAELDDVLSDELDDVSTLTTEFMTGFLARANVPANYANIARANKCCCMQRMLAQCKWDVCRTPTCQVVQLSSVCTIF